MIEVGNIKLATISIAKDIEKCRETQLAGDLQNWLMREKSIICDVKVM